MLYLQIASPKSSVLNFLDSNSFEVIISIFQRTEKVPDMERLPIMTGGLPNEKLCIVKEDKWQVYYSERGNKSGLKIFETETEACEYFLGEIKRYATK